MGVEVTAKGDLQKNLDAFKKRWASKIEYAVIAAGNVVKEAAAYYAPKDTTALANSGYVSKKVGGFNTEITVGFGRSDFDASEYGPERAKRPPYFYALYVHQTNVPFLWIAINAHRDEMLQAFHEKLGI